MSTHMPTLFDDEEFFVPPPKKESKAKKDKKKELTTEPNSEEATAIPTDAAMEANITALELATEENTEIEPQKTASEQGEDAFWETEVHEVIDTDESISEAVSTVEFATKTEETNIATNRQEVIAEDIETLNEAVESEQNERVQIATEDAETVVVNEEEIELTATIEESEAEIIETEDAFVEEGFAPSPEGIEEVANKQEQEEWATPLAHNIQFEIPEEEVEIEEVQVTAPLLIPGIKEEKVDDLDYLMRSEMIIQDYSAFSAFQFEPLPQKEEKKTEVVSDAPITEVPVEAQSTIEHIPIKDIDPETLTFDLDEEEVLPPSTLPEFVLENKYYTIGEVAGMFGVNVSHIRFWTTEFKLKVRTTRKGDRLYNPENIARLRLIHHLVKENGYTIKGAKEKLKTQKSTISTQVDLKEQLTGLKEKLERIKRNL